jgi:hypothetical protein
MPKLRAERQVFPRADIQQLLGRPRAEAATSQLQTGTSSALNAG